MSQDSLDLGDHLESLRVLGGSESDLFLWDFWFRHADPVYLIKIQPIRRAYEGLTGFLLAAKHDGINRVGRA